MLNARVSGIALVVVSDRLASVGEEDSMAVRTLPLQQADGEVLLGNGIGMAIGICRDTCAVARIHLLSQPGAFKRAAGLALPLDRQALQHRRALEQALARPLMRTSRVPARVATLLG